MSCFVTILGSGAAPGVPSLASGWLNCNPNNKKNQRSRASTYIEYNGVNILIDTSPDIRTQLINNNIRHLDAVLYTHTHCDHLLGIDYLREINRISRNSIDFYACEASCGRIINMFPYLISDKNTKKDPVYFPSLIPNIIKEGQDFYVKDVKITPIELHGHGIEVMGYIFNDGEVVYISDFVSINKESLKLIKCKPELLIIPLTTLEHHTRHAGLEKVLMYIEEIDAKKTVINHMAGECDYDKVNSLTPSNVSPAYDNMVIEF